MVKIDVALSSAKCNTGGTLYKHLRHHGKKYNKRSSGKAGRGCIPNRVDIDERPPIVAEKTRLGDWEGDTIIGAKHQGAIVSYVDRCSKFTILKKIDRKTADFGTMATIEKLGQASLPVLTITYDNGKEFSEHGAISKALNVNCYFAKPYHSWERGLNEHTNGLVRQYLPKSTDFTVGKNSKHMGFSKSSGRIHSCVLAGSTGLDRIGCPLSLHYRIRQRLLATSGCIILPRLLFLLDISFEKASPTTPPATRAAPAPPQPQIHNPAPKKSQTPEGKSNHHHTET